MKFFNPLSWKLISLSNVRLSIEPESLTFENDKQEKMLLLHFILNKLNRIIEQTRQTRCGYNASENKNNPTLSFCFTLNRFFEILFVINFT